MPMMMKARQSLHSPFQHGSGTSWWAPLLTSSYFTMPSSSTTIGGLPRKCTDTVTSTLNTLTPVSSSNTSRLSLTPSNWLAPAPNPVSNSRTPLNKWRNSKTYHVNPRPRVQCGSVSLLNVVVQTSGGVMLPALRSPAHSDLLCLM